MHAIGARAPARYGLSGTAEEVAEKVGFRCPAPEGASDFEGLTAALKRCPDTNPFLRQPAKPVPFPQTVFQTSFSIPTFLSATECPCE